MNRPAILIRHDGEGGRELALAPPPGREPEPFLRLTSAAANMLAVALAYPVTHGWEAVPVELCGSDS